MQSQKQLDNLKKGNPKTQFKSGRNAAEAGAKGGIASGIAKRRKRSLRESMELIMSMPLKDGDIKDITQLQSLADAHGKNISVQDAIIMAQVARALKGDQKSAKLVMELFEQMAEKTEEGGVQIVDDF